LKVVPEKVKVEVENVTLKNMIKNFNRIDCSMRGGVGVEESLVCDVELYGEKIRCEMKEDEEKGLRIKCEKL